MSQLHLVFVTEISKLAGEFPDDDPGAVDDVPEGRRMESSPEIPQESIFSDVTPGPVREPDVAPPVGPVSSFEARQNMEHSLQTTEGRRSIRDVLNDIRLRGEGLRGLKRAFTRTLTRSYRSIYGPTPTPRKDLRALLFTDEPNAEARYA
jgi:hypothetical protein